MDSDPATWRNTDVCSIWRNSVGTARWNIVRFARGQFTCHSATGKSAEELEVLTRTETGNQPREVEKLENLTD